MAFQLLFPIAVLACGIALAKDDGAGYGETVARLLHTAKGWLAAFLIIASTICLAGESIIPVPNLADLGITPAVTSDATRIDPPIVGPGDSVRLYLGQDRVSVSDHAPQESIEGLWMHSNLRVSWVTEERFDRIENGDLYYLAEDWNELFVSSVQPGLESDTEFLIYRGLLPDSDQVGGTLLDVSSIPDEAGWDRSADHLTGPGVPSPFDSENVRFEPWIEFRLPEDETLRGTTVHLEVHMTVDSPRRVGGRFRVDNFRIHAFPAIRVAHPEEESQYSEYLDRCWNHVLIQRARLILALVFGLSALFAAERGMDD